ncbi:MAG: hypothetical protein QOH75_2121 [Actinomycetota bacterium]|nr:hypothetical protein [Actinomycetota bacterium]
MHETGSVFAAVRFAVALVGTAVTPICGSVPFVGGAVSCVHVRLAAERLPLLLAVDCRRLGCDG